MAAASASRVLRFAGLLGLAGAPLLRAQVNSPEHHAAIEASYREMRSAVQAGDFAKARALCQQAIASEPRNPQPRYEFAAIEAMIAAREIDVALQALEQATQLGYDRADTLQDDPNLAALRGAPQFARVVAAARANAARATAARNTASAPVAHAGVARGAPLAAAATATQPAAATTKNGVPVGLYFMTRYWSYTHTLEKAAWYFAPDGTVYENLATGFSPADLAAHPGRKGAARFANGKLSVTWSNGETESDQIERDASGFAWEMGTFTPVQPIRSAAALAGNYEGGESLAHGGNQVAVSKRLELHADGTFRWEGVAFTGGATATTQLYAGTSGGSTGTWRADAYSLSLTDAAGHVLRGIAFPYDTGDGKGPADHLFFAGIMYKRL